jgi:hypothetical protein
MVFRVLAGFLAIWLSLGIFAGFYFGEYRHVGGGLVLVGLFLIYAVSGNNMSFKKPRYLIRDNNKDKE